MQGEVEKQEENLGTTQKKIEEAAHSTENDRHKAMKQTPENVRVRVREEAAAKCTRVIERRVLQKTARKARADHPVKCSLMPRRRKIKESRWRSCISTGISRKTEKNGKGTAKRCTLCTLTPCRTRIFFAHFPCVAYRSSRTRMAQDACSAHVISLHLTFSILMFHPPSLPFPHGPFDTTFPVRTIFVELYQTQKRLSRAPPHERRVSLATCPTPRTGYEPKEFDKTTSVDGDTTPINDPNLDGAFMPFVAYFDMLLVRRNPARS